MTTDRPIGLFQIADEATAERVRRERAWPWHDPLIEPPSSLLSDYEAHFPPRDLVPLWPGVDLTGDGPRRYVPPTEEQS